MQDKHIAEGGGNEVLKGLQGNMASGDLLKVQ